MVIIIVDCSSRSLNPEPALGALVSVFSPYTVLVSGFESCRKLYLFQPPSKKFSKVPPLWRRDPKPTFCAPL